MTLLGLDFDNTLVRYDELFHRVAIEKGLIKEELTANKTTIRDYLRRKGQDAEFTLLQGEVYGLRILEAKPSEGLLEKLIEFRQAGIKMVLVSHKTKTPYKGPKYNLRAAAWKWLEKYGFFEESGLGWNHEDVFFESTKGEKIEKIKQLRCTHYVDDLEEILISLEADVEKLWYTNEQKNAEVGIKKFKSWKELHIKNKDTKHL